jgi:hypothetical protein
LFNAEFEDNSIEEVVTSPVYSCSAWTCILPVNLIKFCTECCSAKTIWVGIFYYCLQIWICMNASFLPKMMFILDLMLTEYISWGRQMSLLLLLIIVN